MRLNSQKEYEVTCEKLAELQRWYDEAKNRESENEHVKEMTLFSLGRLIKQLQEEKICYECHAGMRKSGTVAVTTTPSPGDTSTPCTN
jgi:hypothetical protein